MSARGPDRVLLLAGLLGAFALMPLGPWRAAWFQPRPNRLVTGEATGVFELLPTLATAALASWLALIVLACLPRRWRAWSRWSAGPLAAAATLFTFQLAGAGATQLMNGAPASARVSLLACAWLALVACYVAWFAAVQGASRRARLSVVAPAALLTLALLASLTSGGHFADLGLLRELSAQGRDFRAELARHLALAGTSLLAATLVGLPGAALAHRRPGVAAWLLPTVAFFQTVPSLALFGLLLPPLARLGRHVTVEEAALLGLLLVPLASWRWLPGRVARGAALLLALAPTLLYLTVATTVAASAATALLTLSTHDFGVGPLPQRTLASLGVRGIGATPALIALMLYALLPIVRSTYTGLRNVPVAAVEAGRGMGMSPRQLFLRVELPLTLPLLIEGLRAAAVLIIGITTVAYLIGAGGLGVFIQRGIDQVVPDLVLLGALPVIVLALLADGLLRVTGLLLTPAPLRKGTGRAAD